MGALEWALVIILLAYSAFVGLVIKPIVSDGQLKIIQVASLLVLIPLWFFMKIKVYKYLCDRVDEKNNNLES